MGLIRSHLTDILFIFTINRETGQIVVSVVNRLHDWVIYYLLREMLFFVVTERVEYGHSRGIFNSAWG